MEDGQMASEQMSVHAEVAEIIGQYAKRHEVTKADALDRFVRMGISRHNALAKYAKAQAGEGPVKKVAKGKTAPAKAAKEKAPKAKREKKIKGQEQQ